MQFVCIFLFYLYLQMFLIMLILEQEKMMIIKQPRNNQEGYYDLRITDKNGNMYIIGRKIKESEIMKVTIHAAVERIDRIVYIAKNIGWGEGIVVEVRREERGTRECLTDSGVLIIKDMEEDIFVILWQ